MRTTMMMMMMIVRLDVIYGVWLLPAPSGVSMDSVDMRHMLRWRPLQAPCNTTILYSVQFQGEFELMVLKGRWVDASECQQIPHTHCDLTIDLGSDSNYSLRVRACCGSRLSAWSELTRPFNRRQTVLMVPEMTVTLVGDSLHVTFGELPVSAVVNVTVWRRDGKLQSVHTVAAEQKVLHVAALQEGAEYCVRAQTVLDSQLHSNSTEDHCVAIKGPEAAWKQPTVVTVIMTMVITAGLLFAVFCCVVHCRAHTCQTYFHKEPLPLSLKLEREIPLLLKPQEKEPFEQIRLEAGVPR
ncbi:interleukin-20 receptor subunit beta isoform X1 [Mastacembelus armatus]|uniref:Cytokine receptor family member B16 n=1 Tax=Mastacembelus armatus TaxID=205130 RepID=A0A7N9ALX6_9TELE|nr:interleukin-20 receptor subunit beta isoform X1 [Mastacembelus armatus]